MHHPGCKPPLLPGLPLACRWAWRRSPPPSENSGGRTGLKTKDAALLALWEGRIAHLDLQDREGRAEAARILEGAGYDPVWYVEAEDLTGTAPPS